MVFTGFKCIDLCLDPDTGDTKPVITPSGSHVVVSLGAPFELQCRGVKAMQWQREERPKVRGEKKVDGMSTLYVPRAQPAHMGRYICLEESSRERAHIYVYVRGTGAFSVCLSSCAVCLRRECSNLERERTLVYRRSEREQRVWVCLQEKVFVTLPGTGTLDTVAIECIT